MSCLISSATARPLLLQGAVASDLGQLRRPVERDPAHQLGGDVLLRRAARFPDSLVGIAPDLDRAFGLRLDDRPEAAGEAPAPVRMEQDRVERGAEDVVLLLVERAVADSHGACAGVAGEIVPRGFGEVSPPVDPVHDLQRAVLGCLDVGDELHELVRLPVEVEHVQRLERERRVADPGVAVVPVPLAARRLGERGRQRGDGRARRHVREALDRQRRALNRVAEAVVRDAGSAEPGPPEARRRVDLRLGLVGVLRGGQALVPGKGAIGPVAGGENVPGTSAVLLDAQREVGLQANRLPGAAWHRRRGGRLPRAPRSRAHGRSRTPARRRARPRRCPRGTRPSAPACGRRRRRPGAGYGA